MAAFTSFRGTLNPSFSIGKSGVNISQGISAPLNSDGKPGDIYFQLNGTGSKTFQKVGTAWKSLTENEMITVTGDVSGSGTGSLTLTLGSIGSAGTYNLVQTDTKGRVVSGTAIAYLTTNQNITFTGDATGSGNVNVALTLSNIGTAGTYNLIQTDTKGRTISGSLVNYPTVTAPVTNLAIPKYSGTTGGILVNTGVLIDSTNNVIAAGKQILVNSGSTTASGTAAGIHILGDTNAIVGYFRSGAVNTGNLELKAPLGSALIIDVDATSTIQFVAPTTGHHLRYNGTLFINQFPAITDNSDVLITTPLSTHGLFYNGTRWINRQAVLSECSDVTITSPVDGHLLGYNGTRWINEFPQIYGTSVSNTGSASTTSTTYAVMAGLTIVPPAGTYVAQFEVSSAITSNGAGRFALFYNNAQVSGSERFTSVTLAGISLATSTVEAGAAASIIIVANGTAAIDARYRAASGTVTIRERSLTLTRIG